MGVYDDPELQSYVSDIGLRLAKLSERPNLPWQFTVVDQPAVNAFALPGGFIYITRGILPFLDDEAELAGVLGHEIGHVTARHSAQQYTRDVGGMVALGGLGVFVPAARPFGQISEQALGLLFLKYGRDDELQADQLGARYEASAADGIPRVCPACCRRSAASTKRHGDRKGVPELAVHASRAAGARRRRSSRPSRKLKAGRQRTSSPIATALRPHRRRDLRRQPRAGHHARQHLPASAAALPDRLPAKWEIANSPQQVVAKEPDADVFMVLQLRARSRRAQTSGDRARQHAGGRLPRVQGERTTINGLDAFVGVYQGQIEGLGEVASRAAHIAHGGNVYLVAGLVSPAGFDKVDGTLRRAIRSFRPLSRREARGDPSDTRRLLRRADRRHAGPSLAERSGGAIKAGTLAVMNHPLPDAAPRVGRSHQDRGDGMTRDPMSRILRIAAGAGAVAFGVLSLRVSHAARRASARHHQPEDDGVHGVARAGSRALTASR